MSKFNEITTYAARIKAGNLSEGDFCKRASEYKGKLIALVDDEDNVLTSVTVPTEPWIADKKSYSGTLRGAHNRAMVKLGKRNAPSVGTQQNSEPRRTGGSKYGYVEILPEGKAQFYGRDLNSGKYVPCGMMAVVGDTIVFTRDAVKMGYASKVLAGHLGQMIELTGEGKPVGKSDEYSTDGGQTWYATRDQAIEAVTDMTVLKAFLTGKAEIKIRTTNKDGKLGEYVKNAVEHAGLDLPVVK